MIKNLIIKIWNILAGTGLTCLLLLLIVATLTTGAIYSMNYYHFYDLLNNNTVQKWFMEYGFAELSKSWWIILLFALMALLAANTFACTAERIRILLPKRHDMKKRTFFTLLTPSLIHIAFILTLAGHLITYTTITHVRYPIEKDTEILLPGNDKIKVIDIKPINYESSTYLSERLKDAEVLIQFQTRENLPVYKIQFLDPVFIDNSFFHIDVAKNTETLSKPKSGVDVCNRAEVKKTDTEKPQFFLLYTNDPGLFIILSFIFVVAVLMIWYYLNSKILNNQKAGEA